MTTNKSIVERLKPYSSMLDQSDFITTMMRLNEYYTYPQGSVFPKQAVGRTARTPNGYQKNPVYLMGIDPYEGTGDLQTDSLFPTEELRKQLKELNKLKQSKMKTKKFYHTFSLKGREVTTCILVTENFLGRAELNVGYSICHPEDEFDETLAKKIAVGRASKETSVIREFSYSMPSELAFDLAMLKGFAIRFERIIKRGGVILKGIR